MPLPDDLDFDQQPERPAAELDREFNAAHERSYAMGAIKALQAILMVIGKGGDLADVQRVASGALERLENDHANVHG